MKNIFLISFLIFFISCDQSKSLTSYLLPETEFKTKIIHGSFINTVSFLFVIDDSGSMNDEKKYLAKNASLFLTPLLEARPYFNYNFAVTSMGVIGKDESLLYMDLQTIKSDCNLDPSYAIRKSEIGSYFYYKGIDDIKSYSDMVCLVSSNINGTRSNTYENYFKPIKYITDKNDKKFYSDFFGQDKLLILFFISDASGDEFNDKLRGAKKETVAQNLSNELLSSLQIVGAIEKNIRAYAVAPPKQPEPGCNLDDQVATNNPPQHVFSFVERMKGLSTSICNSDWGQQLKDISNDLVQSIPMSYAIYLENIPELDTIEVFFNNKKVPQDFDKGWFLDIEKQAIYFGSTFNLSYYRQDIKFDAEDEVIIKYKPMNIDILQNSD